jgi:predicted outer membrane repeat protein
VLDEGSINAALDAALAAIDDDADTVIICDGEYTYGADISLHDGSAEGFHDVISIEAAADADVTLDGGDQWQLLSFANMTSVSITGIKFLDAQVENDGAAIQIMGGTLNVVDSSFTEGGSATDNGGAIYSEPGHVTISGSTFTGNRAGIEGGAIFVYNAANGDGVTVSDSVFTGNNEAEGAAISVNGAASSAIITVTDSEFVDNDGKYGAITIDGGTVELTNVLMDGNNNSDGDGGAVYAGKGFTATNSRFLNNSVGDNDDGGAVYSSGPLTVTNSVFTGNQVLGNGAEGGAIYAEGACGESASITRSTFINNVAESSAGAINVDCELGDVILLARNTFTGNTSNVAGAVDQDGSNHLLIFQRNVFTANRAIGDEAEGGALWVSNATFSGNRFSRNRSDVYGGAVYATNSTVGRAALRSKFAGNRARRGPDVYHRR